MPFVRYNVPVMIRRIAQERRPRYVDRRRQSASRRRRSPSPTRQLPSRPSQALSGLQNFIASPAGKALIGLASSYLSGGTLPMLPRPPSLPMLPSPRE